MRMPGFIIALFGTLLLTTAPSFAPTSTTGTGGALQVVAADTGIYNAKTQGTQFGSYPNLLRIEGRRFFQLGQQPVNNIRLVYPGFYIAPVGGDVSLGNDYSLEAAIEVTTPVAGTMHLTFAGQNVVNVPALTPYLISDQAAPYDYPSDGQIIVRSAQSIASSSMYMPGYSGGNHSGDGGVISPVTTSQVSGTGALTTPTGGASYAAPPPLAILGVPAAPMVAVCVRGDSIPTGIGETITLLNGSYGFISRGLASVNGHFIPSVRLTVGSDALQTGYGTNSARRNGILQYCTDLIQQESTNDFANSETLSQVQTYSLAEWTRGKRTIGPYNKPLYVTQTLTMPRVNTTYGVTTPLPTISNGGSGYAPSSTFNVTLAGGTLGTGTGQNNAAQISVTTNASGVVTTINSVAVIGYYTSGSGAGATNSPTGGTGTGLALAGLTYTGCLDYTSQTPQAAFVVNGLRDQYNTWVKAQAGTNGVLDAYIDPNPYVESQTQHGYWLPGYSADGVHPTPVGHAAAAQPVTIWAQGRTP